MMAEVVCSGTLSMVSVSVPSNMMSDILLNDSAMELLYSKFPNDTQMGAIFRGVIYLGVQKSDIRCQKSEDGYSRSNVGDSWSVFRLLISARRTLPYRAPIRKTSTAAVA